MKILSINTDDRGGGAARIANDLTVNYAKFGHTSWLVVGEKKTASNQVVEIPVVNNQVKWARIAWKVHSLLTPFSRLKYGKMIRSWTATAASGVHDIETALGLEHFYYPGSRKLLEFIPAQPDIIHAHNLHTDYFDLSYLPRLSAKVPMVVTLHDAWMLTGHCIHPGRCPLWKTGCGPCPDLDMFISISRDATRLNWLRKKIIYRISKLNIVTPCKWLMDMVEKSILSNARMKVIPNGVDISLFHQENKQEMRYLLDLPQKSFILLFVAQGGKKNPMKDYATLDQAVELVSRNEKVGDDPIIFLSLGGEGEERRIGNAILKHIPYQSNPRVVARYYQAADVYLHSAHHDTFPNVILEALGCGTPVIATAVGGIPEQIDEGVTGFLTPPSDPHAMSIKIKLLMKSSGLRQKMGEKAAEVVSRNYSLDRMVENYLQFFEEILASNKTIIKNGRKGDETYQQ